MTLRSWVDHPLPSGEGRVRVTPFMSSRAGKMAASAPSSPERPVAEEGLYPHPNPSPEGRGASEELPCPRISAGDLAARGESRTEPVGADSARMQGRAKRR